MARNARLNKNSYLSCLYIQLRRFRRLPASYRFIYFGIFCLGCFIIAIYQYKPPDSFVTNVNFSRGDYQDPNQRCVLPFLDIDDPLMMSSVKEPSPLHCPTDPADWAHVVNGTLVYSEDVRGRVGDFTCDLSPLLRLRRNDTNIKWGAKVRNFPNGGDIPTDAFKLECRRTEPTRLGKILQVLTWADEYEYSDVLLGVTSHKDRMWKRLESLSPHAGGLHGLSVLMLGFDSMSRMSWLRRMKMTREYTVTSLGGIELQGYNIMGDGTLFPILTGKHEEELPEARRNHAGAMPVDSHPWIWKEFSRAGYVTSWAESSWKYTTFNYRLLGFLKPPTDHYMRPYYLGIAKNSARTKHQEHCRGPIPQHQVWFNYVRDLHQMYGKTPKFFFHFHDSLSHDDNNMLMLADEDLKDLIHYLEVKRYLDSTILVIFADHGARFSNVRQTWAGKLEERLPYMMWRFPRWFQRRYPILMENFRTNAWRLTTPMDIHATLHDIIKFRGKERAKEDRAISLFEEIPAKRSCEQAGIRTHWCACVNWTRVGKPQTDLGTQSAARAACSFINSLTQPHRDLCAELTVSKISSAVKQEANDGVLSFMGARDIDGRMPNFDPLAKSRVKDTFVIYQIIFNTQPGNGSFEVAIGQQGKKWTVSKDAISRINAYGNSSSCILDINRELRQYCYCY